MEGEAINFKAKYGVSDETLKEIVEKFRMVDKNDDGYCSKAEVLSSLESGGMKMSDAEFDEYFKQIDTNGDGKLSLEEIVAFFSK